MDILLCLAPDRIQSLQNAGIHSTAVGSEATVWSSTQGPMNSHWTTSRTFLCSVLVSCTLLPSVCGILSHKAEQHQPEDFWLPSSTAVYRH